MGFNDFLPKKKSEVTTASTQDLQDELLKRQTNQNIFPLDIFHPRVKPYINDLHTKLDIPRSYVGLSMLITYSTAIGTAYCVTRNGSDREYMSIWGCMNGISSSGKSFALDTCLKPLTDIQRDFDEEWINKTDRMTDEKRQHMNMDTVIYRDAYIPTLIRYIMPGNAKGVLKESDEILEWINGMNGLSKKESTDEQFWLSAWNGRGYTAVRSSNIKISIPRVFTNLIGGIQPKLLKRLFQNDRGESGFIFRLLFATPETYKIARPIPGYDVPAEYKAIHETHIKRLYRDLPVESGYEDPKICVMSKEATKMITEWEDKRAIEINKIKDVNEMNIHSGILGKMKQYAYRFAGILCVSDRAFDSESYFPSELVITKDIMARALKASDYFYKTAVDIYEAVENSITAPYAIMNMAMLWKNGTSVSRMAELILKNPKNKGQMHRMIEKAMKEYPKVFGSDNSR